jgi:hypothetical protein
MLVATLLRFPVQFPLAVPVSHSTGKLVGVGATSRYLRYRTPQFKDKIEISAKVVGISEMKEIRFSRVSIK